MLTTIKGFCNHGPIILEETPPVESKTEVIVTFLTEEKQTPSPLKRQLGGLEGQVPLPEDFDEPLDDLKGYR